MSHFSVLVVGPNVEGQMPPFQEDGCSRCPVKYLHFYDIEDDYRKKYDEESLEMLRAPNGELFYTWDNRFKSGTLFDEVTTYPSDYVKVTVAQKDRYETFEDFMRDFCGYEKRDGQHGRFGYWQNPNRKWDWYSIGGRWADFFILKDGSRGHKARKGEIDFEAMRDAAGAEAGVRWDRARALIGDALADFIPWREILAKHVEDIDAARDEYNQQAAVQAIKSDDELLFRGVEDFTCTREVYVEAARASAITTFAILKDGVWHERGKMGMWAIVTDETAKDEWSRQFSALLADIPDNTMLTVVDCHI